MILRSRIRRKPVLSANWVRFRASLSISARSVSSIHPFIWPGLRGEIISVARLDKRILDAAFVGFNVFVVPKDTIISDDFRKKLHRIVSRDRDHGFCFFRCVFFLLLPYFCWISVVHCSSFVARCLLGSAIAENLSGIESGAGDQGSFPRFEQGGPETSIAESEESGGGHRCESRFSR